MKNIRHFMEYAALRAISASLLVLPLEATYLTARFLGWFGFDVLRMRRGITMDNLARALGDTYSRSELVKIAREAYKQITITFIEVLIFPRLRTRMKEVVEVDDFQMVRDAYAEGKGVILVTCHYGSWEIAAATVPSQGIPTTAIGKTQANRYTDRLLNSRRELMGIRITARGAGVKQVVRTLRNGDSIFLVSDQDAGRQGVMVPFFGRPASTPTGAAQLAFKYGSPVLVTACERVSDGRYRFICRKLPVLEHDTVESLAARMNTIIEEIIRRHPEQYLWMHKRWRTEAVSGVGDEVGKFVHIPAGG